MKKIKYGDKFNANGVSWVVVQVGASQSKAETVTPGKTAARIFSNKVIAKGMFKESLNINMGVSRKRLMELADVLSESKYPMVSVNAYVGKLWGVFSDMIHIKSSKKVSVIYDGYVSDGVWAITFGGYDAGDMDTSGFISIFRGHTEGSWQVVLSVSKVGKKEESTTYKVSSSEDLSKLAKKIVTQLDSYFN